MKSIDNTKLPYCGSEGISMGKAMLAWIQARPELPGWDQLKGRKALPTLLGRVAIWQLCAIWQLKPEDEILMPAYNCGTEIDPFLLQGCKVVFYRIDRRAQIDVEDLKRRRTPRTKIVYVTHYFGWSQDLRELVGWCKKEGLRLVEDCALALFSSGPIGPLGSAGDASIFSLGKFISLPAAGMLTLRQDSGIPLPILVEHATGEVLMRTRHLFRMDLLRWAERVGLYPLLRRMKTRYSSTIINEQDLSQLPDMPAEYYFDQDFKNVGMPRISRGLIGAVDPRQVIEQRRKNYTQLEKILQGCRGFEPLFPELPEGVCPLMFPILVENRFAWMEELLRLGIGAYAWWEGYHRGCSWGEFAEAHYLKDHLVCLPVNQGLGFRQMEFIGEAVAVLGSRIR
jgi:perosamine synthetase